MAKAYLIAFFGLEDVSRADIGRQEVRLRSVIVASEYPVTQMNMRTEIQTCILEMPGKDHEDAMRKLGRFLTDTSFHRWTIPWLDAQTRKSLGI